jgi:hypothetical protein
VDRLVGDDAHLGHGQAVGHLDVAAGGYVFRFYIHVERELALLERIARRAPLQRDALRRGGGRGGAGGEGAAGAAANADDDDDGAASDALAASADPQRRRRHRLPPRLAGFCECRPAQ